MSITAPRGVSAPGPPEEVLSGRLGVAEVRRVLLEPLRFGLAGLLDGNGDAPGSLQLLRSKYKPSRLTGWYVSAPADGGPPRHLAVSWSAVDGTTLRVYPDDPSMPQLARLSHPGHVSALIGGLAGVGAGAELAEAGEDARRRLDVWPVRYRPGQRHVLRARLGTGGPGYYLKTDRDVSGAGAVAAATALGPLLAERCTGVRIAEPVGYSPADRTAVWREAPGRPLWHLLADGAAPAPAAALARLGRALREVHDSGLRPSSPGEPGRTGRTHRHDPESEVAATLRAGEHIAVLLPAVGARYRDLARQAGERLEHLPDEPTTLVHGDAKCDNVLVHGRRLRILDLDRCGRADPALDLGRLLADVRWWCPDDPRAGRWSAVLGHGYGADVPRRWARARTWAVLFRLRNTARRCAVHDPAWVSAVRTGVAGAATALAVEQVRP
jgi:Phosphotransferase enzyme family